MSILNVLEARRGELGGRVMTAEEAESLAAAISLPIDWLIGIMRAYPLIGCGFSLDRARDQSNLGVDLSWMSPDDVVDESTEFRGEAKIQLPLKFPFDRLVWSDWRARNPAFRAWLPRVVVRMFCSSYPLLKFRVTLEGEPLKFAEPLMSMPGILKLPMPFELL